MSQDNYGALMLKRALATTVNLATVKAPGVYPVDAGNATAPGSAAGELLVYLPTAQTKQEFISAAGAKFVRGSALGSWVELVPSTRKINGHLLTDDFDLSAADVKAMAVTNVRAMANPSAGNVGDADELPANATSFVYINVPNAPSFTGSLLDFSGLGNGYNTQIVAAYAGAGERIGFRTRNGDKKTWNPWYELYHNGKEVQATIPSNFRIAYGGYGVFWRNDGARHYLMLTNKDNEFGNFNNLRPFYVDIATGKCQFGHDVGFSGNIYGNGVIQPGNYSNFDTRYYTKSQTDAAYMAKTGAYTKGESDTRYMAKTGAYTKGESDTRYQLKNSASLGDNGWHRDASTGLITQWMRVNRVGQYLTSFNFPMAFPSKCLAITFGEINTDNRSSQVNIWVYQYSRTGATIRMEEGERATFIIAKGY